MKKKPTFRIISTHDLAKIATGLRTRVTNHTNAAKVSSKAGDLIETIINSVKAGILNDVAEEFEHEAGR